nr:hypothetical protein [uncultured archaeon]
MVDFGKYVYCEIDEEEDEPITCGCSEERAYKPFKKEILNAKEMVIKGGRTRIGKNAFGNRYVSIEPAELDQLSLSKEDDKIEVSEVRE